MDMVDEKSLPDNHLLIEAGEGEIFHYTVSGLDFVYVRGMVEEHPTMPGWFRLKKLQEVNAQISDYILAQESMPATHFRFLRKEVGLSIVQICVELGLVVEAVDAWENGDGFMPTGVEGICAVYRKFRSLGYAAFVQSHSAKALAA
jgi:DNA-binding transcriptional regulator YiaG